MKIVFFILAFLHGLIHSLGAIKAFGLAAIKDLTLPVSKPMGIAWMAVTALFLLCGLLWIINSQFAWLAGMLAVIVSQTLIVLYWKDARVGTIPNIIILLVSLAGLGTYIMRSEFNRCVKKDFLQNNSLSTAMLTENDMAHLPAPVRKYLYYTGSVGKPKVKNFRAEFTGGMRSGPADKFMNMHSVQYNFYERPSRYFYMTASRMGIPATGLHIYRNETATFRVKLFSWFTLVDAKGDKMNQAETVTLLNDMCCIAPPTLIDKRIQWESVNDTTVKAIFTNGHITVSAMLYFNAAGGLVNFISNDRYNTDGKSYESYPWATPLGDYKRMSGYLLPGRAKLIYQRPDGEFIYGELEYRSVQFNLEGI